MIKILPLFLFITFSLYSLDLLPPMENYVVTSEVGVRKSPMGGGGLHFHKGMDLVGRHRAPVRATAYGKIVAHWPPPNGYYGGHPSFGGCIVIFHGRGLYTLYGHLSRTFVRKGYMVQLGQVIGLQGDTGISTGEHLHFEVIIDPTILFDPDMKRSLINIIVE